MMYNKPKETWRRLWLRHRYRSVYLAAFGQFRLTRVRLHKQDSLKHSEVILCFLLQIITSFLTRIAKFARPLKNEQFSMRVRVECSFVINDSMALQWVSHCG